MFPSVAGQSYPINQSIKPRSFSEGGSFSRGEGEGWVIIPGDVNFNVQKPPFVMKMVLIYYYYYLMALELIIDKLFLTKIQLQREEGFSPVTTYARVRHWSNQTYTKTHSFMSSLWMNGKPRDSRVLKSGSLDRIRTKTSLGIQDPGDAIWMKFRPKNGGSATSFWGARSCRVDLWTMVEGGWQTHCC